MSNHSAGYMVNDFLKEFINNGYMDRFNDDEKYKLEQIFEQVVKRYDGNINEMLVGLGDYFGICTCCCERKKPEEMKGDICYECRHSHYGEDLKN